MGKHAYFMCGCIFATCILGGIGVWGYTEFDISRTELNRQQQSRITELESRITETSNRFEEGLRKQESIIRSTASSTQKLRELVQILRDNYSYFISSSN